MKKTNERYWNGRFRPKLTDFVSYRMCVQKEWLQAAATGAWRKRKEWMRGINLTIAFHAKRHDFS